MTLMQLSFIIVITAVLCGLLGLSLPLAFLVTLVVAATTFAIRELCFPNPWKPIEQLKGQVPSDLALLIAAKRRAVDSLPLFWSLCADGVPPEAKVRVQLTDRRGESEDAWMFLLSPPDDDGKVHVHPF